VRSPEGNTQFVRNFNITGNLKNKYFEALDLIKLDRNRAQWWVVINQVFSLPSYKKLGISLPSVGLSFSERLNTKFSSLVTYASCLLYAHITVLQSRLIPFF
jgi:hypothetical protein